MKLHPTRACYEIFFCLFSLELPKTLIVTWIPFPPIGLLQTRFYEYMKRERQRKTGRREGRSRQTRKKLHTSTA